MENTGLVFKMYTDLTNYSKGLKQAGGELNQFQNNMKKIGGAIAAAFSVAAVTNFAKEAVQLASQAEAVEKAFSRIGGDQFLQGMRDATRGTVTDLELMKRAVAANNFQIPLENLATLFEFARRRAEETGESVDYLVDSIVKGIGRKSPLILDNLGISATALKEKLGGVSTEAASIGDVARAVGSIATEQLSKMGAEAVTAQQSMAAITTEWTNLKTEIGKAIIESDGFKAALSGIQGILDRVKSRNALSDAKGLAVFGLSSIDTSNINQVNSLLENVKKTQAQLGTKYDTWLDYLMNNQTAGQAKKLNEQLSPLYQTLMGIKTALDNQKNMGPLPFDYDGLKKTTDGIKAITGLYGKLEEKIKNYKEQINATYSEATIRMMRRKIEMLELEKQYYDSIGTAIAKMNPKSAGVIPNPVNAGAMTVRNSAGAVNLGNADDPPSLYELQETAQQAGALLTNFKQEILSTAAEGFGLLISGDMGLNEFFKSILMVTADFAKQFGEMLIAIGIGKEAATNLGAATGGVGAIIAGMALIASATAIKALLNDGPEYQGLATGTNYVPADGPYYLHKGEAVVPEKYNPGNGDNPIIFNFGSVIRGNDLKIIAERTDYKRMRTIGR